MDKANNRYFTIEYYSGNGGIAFNSSRPFIFKKGTDNYFVLQKTRFRIQETDATTEDLFVFNVPTLTTGTVLQIKVDSDVCTSDSVIEVVSGSASDTPVFRVGYDGVVRINNTVGNNVFQLYPLSGSGFVFDCDADYYFRRNSANIMVVANSSIRTMKQFRPSTNDSIDLGDSSYYWKTGYIRTCLLYTSPSPRD